MHKSVNRCTYAIYIETKFQTVWIYSEPTAEAGANQSSIRGVSINFNGQGSDIDGQIVLWEWDFDGDGIFDWSSTDSGVTTRSYSEIGDFNPVLRVTDNDGFIASDSFSLQIETEKITFPKDNPSETSALVYASGIGEGTDPEFHQRGLALKHLCD